MRNWFTQNALAVINLLALAIQSDSRVSSARGGLRSPSRFVDTSTDYQYHHGIGVRLTCCAFFF